MSQNRHDNTKRSDAKVAASTAVTGTPRDVICGRGFHVSNHHGNLRLHILVNKWRQRYFKARRKDKPAIIRRIVQEVKDTGSRFLKRETNNGVTTWVELDEDSSYEKISQALRKKSKCSMIRFPEFEDNASGNLDGRDRSDQHHHLGHHLPHHPPSTATSSIPAALGEPNADHNTGMANAGAGHVVLVNQIPLLLSTYTTPAPSFQVIMVPVAMLRPDLRYPTVAAGQQGPLHASPDQVASSMATSTLIPAVPPVSMHSLIGYSASSHPGPSNATSS